MSFRLPLAVNMLGVAEISAAKATLDSGFLTMGKLCERFEREFADYLGVDHAVMVNSGSSANLIALFALANPLVPLDGGRRKLMPGDEVIVPAMAWSTTIWPVLQAGAMPVFVDCDPQTLQVTPAAIEAAITPRTVAIVLVHVLGGACNIEEISEIATRHRIWLFEDTCESLGVTWNGRKVGSFGDMGSFSFYFSHHITTIEGGMVVTDNARLADLLRALRAHGWARDMKNAAEVAAHYPDIDPRFLFVTTGFNVRPSEINAAIGLEQLKRLEGFNARRRDLAARFNKGLAAIQQAGHLQLINFDPRSVAAPFGYSVVCETQGARDGLRQHLEAGGIETRPIICGNIVRQPAFANFDHRVSGELAGADRVMDCGIYWGLHPGMTEQDVDSVVQYVRAFFDRHEPR